MIDNPSSSITGTVPTTPVAQDYLLLSYKDITTHWSSFVASFISSPTVRAAVDCFPCFPMVLKACSYWLRRLTRECCGHFETHFDTMRVRFTNVEGILRDELELPFVFIDQDTFETGDLLNRHKFVTLKLNEGIQILHEKREQAQEQLDIIQATKGGEEFEFQIFHDGKVNSTTTNTRVLRNLLDLGTCLYRLHVQFIMCLEIYAGYLEKVTKVAGKQEVSAISQVLFLLSKRMNCALLTLKSYLKLQTFQLEFQRWNCYFEGNVEVSLEHLKPQWDPVKSHNSIFLWYVSRELNHF